MVNKKHNKQNTFTKSFKVYFGDTDAAGVVHHARYIYWLEAARIDYLDHLGCSYKMLQNNNIGLMPKDISISYIKSLKFADEFTIDINISHVGHASITIEGNIFLNNQLVTKSSVKLACINEKTWKPIKLPDPLIDAIKKSK